MFCVCCVVALQGQLSGRLQWDKPSEPDKAAGAVGGLGHGSVVAGPAAHTLGAQVVANLTFEMEAKVHDDTHTQILLILERR